MSLFFAILAEQISINLQYMDREFTDLRMYTPCYSNCLDCSGPKAIRKYTRIRINHALSEFVYFAIMYACIKILCYNVLCILGLIGN